MKRVVGDADELWEKYSCETCSKSYKEYSEFLQGREKATFIQLRNSQKLSSPVSEKNLFKIVGVRTPRGQIYKQRGSQPINLRGAGYFGEV